MPANVFLLDPAFSDEAEPRLPQFLQLGERRAGWQVSRAVEFKSGMDGGRWFAELRQKIEQADILVSLGRFLALYQTGSELAAFLELIGKKLDSGAFGFFDGCSSLTNNHFPDLDLQIRTFFDRKGIRLSFKKVANRVEDYKEHSSPYCCGFRKVDDCLLDPSLFDGVDVVWCYGNRLISYDDAFPLIEPGTLHQYIDQGDFETSGALGQKNAVAVRKRNLLVSTGGILSDRRETMGGQLPGFEDNKLFAERVLDNFFGTRAPSLQWEAFELFSELEMTFGKLIEDVLARSSAEASFIQLLPEKMLTKLKSPDGSIDFART